MVLTILSYNVWFGTSESDYMHRIVKIVSQIKDTGPDILCLQEVVCLPQTVELLQSIGYMVFLSPTVRPYRELIAINPHTCQGTVIPIVKFPGSSMGRELLIVKIQYGDVCMHVGTAHLESMYQFKEEQLKQLGITFKEMSRLENAFICADTNLLIDNALRIPSGWTDTFIDANSPINHRYTYSSKTNNNIIKRGRHISTRYDRIFKYGNKFKVASFTLFGKENPQSDHYGVLVTIQLT